MGLGAVRGGASRLGGRIIAAFPSHMILYKEQRAYTHGEIIWPD